MDAAITILILFSAAFIIVIFKFFVIKAGGQYWFDRVLGITLLISLIVFYYFDLGGAKYTEAVTEPGFDEQGYEAFSSDHVLSFLIILALSFCALFLVWWRNVSLPPILFVFSWAMITIGVCDFVAITIQIGLNMLAICYFLIAIVLLKRCMKTISELAPQKINNRPLLNRLNELILKTKFMPIWVLILTAPLFLVIILILILFGQDSHAIIKVFTETTTWGLSEKQHPPYLPHTGHYLCTVAAHGNHNIVKPLGYGLRHGHPIIVNRQLRIANAFEELIQDGFPALHKIIRGAYDKYGYPLSEKINTRNLSNLTYILMKPLELFFLLVLYTLCIYPEVKIARQYS